MTTPQAPPQQVPPGQVPPPQQDPLDNPLIAVAVAELLLTAVSAAAMIAALKLRFALSATIWTAMEGVADDVMKSPPPVTGVIGNASAQTARMNAARRAQYVLAATKRTVTAMREARSQGKPVLGAMKDQLATERRYYAQHQAAMWNRATAAGKTDMEAAVHGDLLGWNAVKDKRTSPECRAADGKNYYASAMPVIGFPGSVHLVPLLPVCAASWREAVAEQASELQEGGVMAEEAPKVTEPAAAKDLVKATPVPAPAPPKPAAAPTPKPEPAREPDRMTVKMANAANGARYPGEVVEVDAETGRALIQAGEAYPV